MAPVHGAAREMKHEVEHARAGVAPGQPGIKPLSLAGDACKAGDRREQRIEQIRAHGDDNNAGPAPEVIGRAGFDAIKLFGVATPEQGAGNRNADALQHF